VPGRLRIVSIALDLTALRGGRTRCSVRGGRDDNPHGEKRGKADHHNVPAQNLSVPFHKSGDALRA
jgi:hypothetical protein